MSDIERTEEEDFIDNIRQTHQIYISSGARSSKKVDFLHAFLKKSINDASPDEYHVKLEKDLPSINASGKKKCDIVLYKGEEPFAVFPVKFIMSNYNQNKNNNWENLTGEVQHLKWANSDLHIIPINIIESIIPYLESNKKIKKFEKIVYDKTYKIYDMLKKNGICTDICNYIIDVNQKCVIHEEYKTCPDFVKFSEDTPFRSFKQILSPILN
tara:strand:- start:79 stop:717 length:639 start_codon:yes stop_codon:yes gene_type:complete